MGIALFSFYDLLIRRKSRIPSAMFPVPELSLKTPDRSFCQFLTARILHPGTYAVHMGHAAGDPGLPVPVLPGRPIIAKIITGASGRRKPPAKIKKRPCIVP